METRVSYFLDYYTKPPTLWRLSGNTRSAVFCAVWVAFSASLKLQAEEFIDNHDLNGDYARYVYRVEGMRVWNQSENGYGVREWGPVETDKVGTLVFRYCFDRPIESASLQAAVRLWRERDEASVAVSPDDQHYTILTTDSMLVDPEIPDRVRVLDLTPYVAGKRTVYIRFQAKGRRLNSHIMTPSILRTVRILAANNAPYVYEFRAKLRSAAEEEMTD